MQFTDNITAARAVDREFVYIGFDRGIPLGRLGLPPSNFKLNVHRLRCLCTESSLLEHATGAAGATGAAEVVSRTAARSPPPTRAGGQDDGSYTNSLKLIPSLLVFHQIVDFDIVFTMHIQLFHEKTLFHLEPSEVCL